MARLKKNVNTKGLTQEERDEFLSVGYVDERIDKIEELLKRETWLFRHDASDAFITLMGGEEVFIRNGKAQTKDISRSIKFDFHYKQVNDRETAKLVFLTDAYREGRLKLAEDYVKDEKEKEYNKFKGTVLRDKEMVERLKKELSA